jgi:predicted DNA-binding transcriptional regulator AlpA
MSKSTISAAHSQPTQSNIRYISTPNAKNTVHSSDNTPANHDRFLKIEVVLDRVGIARSTLYLYISQGRFPAQIKIGRASYWSEITINAWMNAQKTGGIQA